MSKSEIQRVLELINFESAFVDWDGSLEIVLNKEQITQLLDLLELFHSLLDVAVGEARKRD